MEHNRELEHDVALVRLQQSGDRVRSLLCFACRANGSRQKTPATVAQPIVAGVRSCLTADYAPACTIHLTATRRWSFSASTPSKLPRLILLLPIDRQRDGDAEDRREVGRCDGGGGGHARADRTEYHQVRIQLEFTAGIHEPQRRAAAGGRKARSLLLEQFPSPSTTTSAESRTPLIVESNI